MLYAMPMQDSDELFPRLLADRYQLEKKLGQGGMGIVCRATDLAIQRPVAVKLVRRIDGVDIDEDLASRFLREARNTARIKHDHIVDVFDMGRTSDGDLFFVMELLDGQSLSTKLRTEGPLEPEVVVHIARQMCGALHMAHQNGIVHRDIKPANIMLVTRGNDENFVKLLDFGVAKSNSPDQTQLTRTGMLVGTVEYMSPEQIAGRTLDGRADMYSFGIVMYRMLTGKTPFRDGGGVPAMINAHLNAVPEPVSKLVGDVPVLLEQIVAKCLAKKPEQRYADMGELARALARVFDPTQGLVNLEYGADDDDPYLLDDATAQADDPLYNDATIKLERGGPQPRGRIDRTALLRRGPKQPAPNPERVLRTERTESFECAMCHTLNPAGVRACVACGVAVTPMKIPLVGGPISSNPGLSSSGSLPSSGGLSSGGLPIPNIPTSSGAYPADGPVSRPVKRSPLDVPPDWVNTGANAAAGDPARQSSANASGSHPKVVQPRSAWDRFLAWAGFRGR